MRSVTILGASGSIGKNAIAFVRLHRDKFHLKNIAMNSDWRFAVELFQEFGFTGVAFGDAAAADEFRAHVTAGQCEIFAGPGSAAKLACDPVDVVLAAISGTSGFPSVVAAVRSGNRVAVANKEAVICGGRQLLDLARKLGVDVIPVDSEHSAIFQSMLAGKPSEVASILLTASGGPFRTASLEEMLAATPKQALAHPNWAMGAKNSLDSATLANKGLELIEAQWLFGLRPEQCDAVIHPQSIVHCLVEFADGAMLAQLCPPSMTFPIQHALLYPERAPAATDTALPLDKVFALDFRPADETRYPCLRLAREAMAAGGTAPAVFNAANEVAVAAFLAQRAPFLAIPRIIEHTLATVKLIEPSTLDQVLTVDAEARRIALHFPT